MKIRTVGLLFYTLAFWSQEILADIPCNILDLGCKAEYLLPKNSDGINQKSTEKREWSASRGYVVGYSNVIEFRLRFDDESLRTLHATSLSGYPFGLGDMQ